MLIGWLHDRPPFMGGAELTMREFAAAAPSGVEVIDCPPGRVATGLDRYVIGNCITYSAAEVEPVWAEAVRYHHDVAKAPADVALDAELVEHVFCSPLQREWMEMGGDCIPPALDLDAFRRRAGANHRSGAVCIGRMAYGKGVQLLTEYGEPVDVYSTVPLTSTGSLRYQGIAEDVATTLSRYERFVFLPTSIEPFGRAIVEAWAAGLKIITNRNVGSVHWIRNDPGGLESAADDLWNRITG